MKSIPLNDTIKEIHCALIFDSPQSAQKKLSDAKNDLELTNAKIISLEVFGPKWLKSTVEYFKGNQKFPVNWIYPLNDDSKPILAGAHIIALVGDSPEFKETTNGTCAVEYSDGYFKYCRTFGVVAPTESEDGYEHTISNLNELEKTLALFGYSYNDIARTWFYNDDILTWYDPFNKARTLFYNQRNIFDGLLPASTGIGSPNPSGKKIVSGAIAVKPIAENVSVIEVESPLQCGAPKYGSSFSRAVEIKTPHSTRIMISGTASIEPMGKTAHVDDIKKQVALTMDVIKAILVSRGLSLSNTVRAVAYCLCPEYYEAFQAWMKENKCEIAHCPSFSIVCRNDLLFEVELEAAKSNK